MRSFLRRRVAADAHQRPTRRFRQLLEPPLRAGQARRAGLALEPAHPSLFGLAPCGVYPASVFTAGAVRSYRTFSPLPGLAVQAYALRASLPAPKRAQPAVCFLWHWPSTGLEARVPDVIRHTALRSSDFPPPEIRLREAPAATARSSCQVLVYREIGNERRCGSACRPTWKPQNRGRVRASARASPPLG
jgi:hypothetical protein